MPDRLRSDPMSVAEADLVLRRYGRGALLPFQLGADKNRFLTGSGAVVVFGRYGRYVVALGDPIGPETSSEGAWAAFIGECHTRHRIPAIYQASQERLTELRALGLRPFAVGSEAILDLTSFDLRGSRRANLRHTITRARKDGVTFRFHPTGIPATESDLVVRSLIEIDRRWSTAAGPPLGFTIGQFDPDELGSLAIAIATDSHGVPIAFTTFRATGTDDGWVVDLLRRAPGGPPGATEGTLVEAAGGLRDIGVPSLSLGLAPLARLGDGSTSIEERALIAAARLVRPLYDVRGLAFFKNKFDPRWEPRYIALAKRRHLPGLAVVLVGLHAGSLRSVGRGAVSGLIANGRSRIRRTTPARQPTKP